LKIYWTVARMRVDEEGSDSSATRSSIDLGSEQVEVAKRLHRDFAVIGCHH
jgi:hypothetical protein